MSNESLVIFRKLFWRHVAPHQHPPLALQRPGAGQVVGGHYPSVEHAPAGVDPLRSPPITVLAQDCEQVPLVERQLVREAGVEPPHGRVKRAPVRRRLDVSSWWVLLLPEHSVPQRLQTRTRTPQTLFHRAPIKGALLLGRPSGGAGVRTHLLDGSVDVALLRESVECDTDAQHLFLTVTPENATMQHRSHNSACFARHCDTAAPEAGLTDSRLWRHSQSPTPAWRAKNMSQWNMTCVKPCLSDCDACVPGNVREISDKNIMKKLFLFSGDKGFCVNCSSAKHISIVSPTSNKRLRCWLEMCYQTYCNKAIINHLTKRWFMLRAKDTLRHFDN